MKGKTFLLLLLFLCVGTAAWAETDPDKLVKVELTSSEQIVDGLTIVMKSNVYTNGTGGYLQCDASGDSLGNIWIAEGNEVAGNNRYAQLMLEVEDAAAASPKFALKLGNGEYVNALENNQNLTVSSTPHYFEVIKIEEENVGVGFAFKYTDGEGTASYLLSGKVNNWNSGLTTTPPTVVETGACWTLYEVVQAQVIDRANWDLKCSSWSSDGGAGGIGAIKDGDANTWWHSAYNNSGSGNGTYNLGLPQWFTIDMKEAKIITEFGYTRRQDGGNGYVTGYKLYVSEHPFELTVPMTAATKDEINNLGLAPVAEGTLENKGGEQKVVLPVPAAGQYVLFVVTKTNGSYASCGEFNLYTMASGHEKDLLAEAIVLAEAQLAETPTGNNVGYWLASDKALAEDAVTEAQSALDAAGSTSQDYVNALAALDEAINEFLGKRLMPKAGQTYMLVSAKDGDFYTGENKAMYSDGSDLLWGNKNVAKNNYYWTLVADGNGFKVKNGDGRYIFGKTGDGTDHDDATWFSMVDRQAEGSSVEFEHISADRWLIKIAGNHPAHPSGHRGASGTVISYRNEGNNASCWKLIPVSGYDVYPLTSESAPSLVNPVITRETTTSETTTSETALLGGFFVSPAGTTLSGTFSITSTAGYTSSVAVADGEVKVTFTAKAFAERLAEILAANNGLVRLKSHYGNYVACQEGNKMKRTTATEEELARWSQIWQITALDGGGYTIRNAHTGLYVQGFVGQDQTFLLASTPVTYYIDASNSPDHSNWYRLSVKSDFSGITSMHDANNQNGVVGWYSDNNASAWDIVPVTDVSLEEGAAKVRLTTTLAANNGFVRLKSHYDNYVVYQVQNGAKRTAMDAEGTTTYSQIWQIAALADGGYTLCNMNSGKYMQGYVGANQTFLLASAPVTYYIGASHSTTHSEWYRLSDRSNFPDYHCMHDANNQNGVVGWHSPNADQNAASAWNIIAAEDATPEGAAAAQERYAVEENAWAKLSEILEVNGGLVRLTTDQENGYVLSESGNHKLEMQAPDNNNLSQVWTLSVSGTNATFTNASSGYNIDRTKNPYTDLPTKDTDSPSYIMVASSATADAPLFTFGHPENRNNSWYYDGNGVGGVDMASLSGKTVGVAFSVAAADDVLELTVLKGDGTSATRKASGDYSNALLDSDGANAIAQYTGENAPEALAAQPNVGVNGVWNSLVLADDADFDAGENSYAAKNVTYSRTLYAGWNTVCLPFAFSTADLPAGCKVEMFRETLGEGSEMVLVFEEATEIPAGVPCLVQNGASEDITWNFSKTDDSGIAFVGRPAIDAASAYYMNGSFTEKTIGAGHYKMNNAGDAFGQTSDAGKTFAFRAYVSPTVAEGAAALRVLHGAGNLTGIDSIDNGELTIDGGIYDLSGRRVANPVKGEIYIIGGQKVMFK